MNLQKNEETMTSCLQLTSCMVFIWSGVPMLTFHRSTCWKPISEWKKKNDVYEELSLKKGSIFNFSARFLQPSNHLQSHPLATRPDCVSRMSPKMLFFSTEVNGNKMLAIENRSISINKLYIFMHSETLHLKLSMLYLYGGADSGLNMPNSNRKTVLGCSVFYLTCDLAFLGFNSPIWYQDGIRNKMEF